MKTTVEISDPLLKQAKRAAEQQGTTLRALIERGLQAILRERTTQPFRLQDASFEGRGLQPEAVGRSWEELRALTYAGRGD